MDGRGRIAAGSHGVARDHGFHVGMAVAIAATVIGGFGSFALRGQVDIARVPYWVHVHGAVFMAWTLIFVAQAVLAQRGSRALHRRLGWIAAGLVVVMVPLALGTAAMSVRMGRVPPFFPDTIFVALNLLEVSAFGGLLIAAIRLRRRTDWHKRLMLCAMVAMIGPAFGRILPMPLLGPWGGLAVMSGQLLFVLVAMVHDLRSRGRVHAACWIGAAVIAIEGLAVPMLAATPPVIALTEALARS